MILCMHREDVSNLEPLDPEIERTCRRNRKEQRQKVNMADNNNAGHNGNIGADRNWALKEFDVPHLEGLTASIAHPQITGNNFELKSVMFQMLQAIGPFNGLPNEDPNMYLMNFLAICDSFK